MVIMSLALALHVLAAVVWVGGMFFAYVCLRPVLVECEPAERLQIWARTFGKFFSLGNNGNRHIVSYRLLHAVCDGRFWPCW